MTKQEIISMIQEYQVESILWMLFILTSLVLIITLSTRHIFFKEKYISTKANDLFKNISGRPEYANKSNKRLIELNKALIIQNRELNNSTLDKSIEIFKCNQTINILENDKKKLISENENLKIKVDNLVYELMKRQSYNGIGIKS